MEGWRWGGGVKGDLEPISDGLDDVFRRLGLSNPRIHAVLVAEWDRLAGAPWAGRSKPVVVQGTTLVVEATSASTVTLLRYGESSLVEILKGRFGEGIVTKIEVVPPARR